MEKIISDEIELIDNRSGPYCLTFLEQAITPTLDRYIHAGNPRDGRPFVPRDLDFNRVGFKSISQSGEIYCVPMSWAQHVYMNVKEVREILPKGEQLGALSVSVLLETSDRKFVLTLRSKEVELYPGCWHISAGGYVDLLKAMKSRNFLHTVFTEVEEETNITPKYVEFVEQLFLCRNLSTKSSLVEACFYSRTNLNQHEIASLAPRASDAYEGQIRVLSINDIRKLLDNEPFVPSARAIFSFLRERWS